MKLEYIHPEIEIIMLEAEQCIMIGSNTPGLGEGTDLDELLD